MSKRLSIELPEALRQEIIDCKAWMQEQLEASEKASGAKSAKIRELEAIIRELETRAAGLHPRIVESDAIASELLIVERRLTFARVALERVQSTCFPGVRIDLTPAHHLLDRIVAFYREELPRRMRWAMAPFGYPDHLLVPLAAHATAIRALNIFRDYPPKFAHDLEAIFNRALRGQVDLSHDEPVEAVAPSAQPDPSAAEQTI